jgi:hypothetical protein
MELKVGSAITYVDSYGRPRPALITSMWTSGSTMRSVNVVVVNDDENQTDTFGRKIEPFKRRLETTGTNSASLAHCDLNATGVSRNKG